MGEQYLVNSWVSWTPQFRIIRCPNQKNEICLEKIIWLRWKWCWCWRCRQRVQFWENRMTWPFNDWALPCSSSPLTTSASVRATGVHCLFLKREAALDQTFARVCSWWGKPFSPVFQIVTQPHSGKKSLLLIVMTFLILGAQHRLHYWRKQWICVSSPNMAIIIELQQ